MFTIESSTDITPEEVTRLIEHRFYLDNAFTIKKCNNKKLRFVTRTNPYSTEPRPTSANFNQDLIKFNNVDIKTSIDFPFQICSSYFNSSCCLHESLVCIDNDHE